MNKKIILYSSAIIFTVLAVTGVHVALAEQQLARYSGYLLSDPGNNKIWYVSPVDQKRYDIGTSPGEAFDIIKNYALEISGADLEQITKPNELFLGDRDLSKRLSGRFILTPENKNIIWYVHPTNLKRYYFINTDASFTFLRSMAVSFKADDLKKIAMAPGQPVASAMPTTDAQPETARPAIINKPLTDAQPTAVLQTTQSTTTVVQIADARPITATQPIILDSRPLAESAPITQVQTSYDYQTSSYTETRLCAERVCEEKPSFTLKSNFLSSDPTALQIIAKDRAINLADLSISDKNSFIYKIYNALIMIGYSPQYSNVVNWGNGNLLTLYQFQKNNNLNQENYLTPQALKLLDAQLQKYEQIYSYHAPSFPLYSKMISGRPNEVSREFIATLYQLPMSLLPSKLQLKSANDWVTCMLGQCVGRMLNPDGTSPNNSPKTGYLPDPNNYLFDPFWFSESAYFPQDNAALFIMTVMHEYGHNIDKAQNPANLADTSGFYNIGFIMSQQPGKNLCGTRRSNSMGDFLTAYGYTGSAVAGYCPRGMIKVTEDFADSFAFYIGAGKLFRAATVKNSYLQNKYNWLKNNIFEGVEYDTDLISNIPSGCNGRPGYASCSEDYVWDGTLKKL